jgi:hypothetical protein
MIIQNGTIEAEVKTGGGVDSSTGFPVRPTVSWGEPIPCQFSANSMNRLGRANGEHFTLASYEVFIEEQTFTAERLRLTDEAGNVIGIFSVIQVAPLQTVCEIRILV